MKKLNLKSIFTGLEQVLYRFPVVLLFVASLAFMAFMNINDTDFEPEMPVWTFLGLSVFASLALTLLFEQYAKRPLYFISLLAFEGVLLLYNFMFFNHKIDWEGQQMAMMFISLVLALFVILFLKPKTDKSFWSFTELIVRELISTGIYAGLLMGGLSLALFAIDTLFGVDFTDKVYGNLAVVCFIIFAPVYFLSNIPAKDKIYSIESDFGKFLKILGLYVILPILGVYVVILYAYLAKIIFTWELPNGWVTTLVSVLALGGYVAKFLLYPMSDNKVVNFLNRYFSLLLMPLVVLMTIGLFRRISDYGISINRLYVLVFNVWLYGVSVFLILTQSRSLKWLVISFVSVLFVVSVGPWSVYSITERTIRTELNEQLTTHKLLINGKLVNNKDGHLKITDSVDTAISGKLRYYITTFGQDNFKTAFGFSEKSAYSYDVLNYLGIGYEKDYDQNSYLNAQLSGNLLINISAYSTCIANIDKDYKTDLLYEDLNYKLMLNKSTIEITSIKTNELTQIPLAELMKQLSKNDENNIITDKLLQVKQGKYLLVFDNISANRKPKAEFKITDLRFTLYVK